MESWNYQLPPVLAAIRPAVNEFREWATERANAAAAADCALALVEACNNLIAHNPNLHEAIRLKAEATAFELVLTIHDSTDGFEWPKEPTLPPNDAEAGRGIFLMHALRSEVEYQRNGGANELRLRRRL